MPGEPALKLTDETAKAQCAAWRARFMLECQRQGLAFGQVAERIGCSKALMTYIVSYGRVPNLELAIAIARVLGLDLADMTAVPECGRSWDDSIFTSTTPAPSALCPFEYAHEDDEPAAVPPAVTLSPRADVMHAHDGYAPHSHEVRADHGGVAKEGQGT